MFYQLLFILLSILAILMGININSEISGGYIESNTLQEHMKNNAGIYVNQASVIYGSIHLDKPINEEYFGNWNRNTIVAIGSCGKSVVDTSLCELAKAGVLSLSDPVKKYFPTLSDYDNVTIADVMAHRSGLIEYVYGTDQHHKLTHDLPLDSPIICRRTWVERRLSMKPDYTPLSLTKYNNDNLCIIASIIEKVTNKNYQDIINEYVAKPLGIKFYWGYQEDVIGHIISGWGARPQKISATETYWKITPYSEPSGDIFMSIWDFYIYVRAHAQSFVNQKPFSPDLYKPVGDKALGWSVKNDIRYHTGGAFGHSSKMAIKKDGKFIIGIQSTLFCDDYGLFSYVDNKIKLP